MGLAALKVTIPDLDAQDFFLARQPVLNLEQELVAYELLFRSTGARNQASFNDDMSATAAVITHAAELGLHNVIGTSLAFINVDAHILMSDAIFVLPKEHVVLEILETVEPTAEVMQRIALFVQAGYNFALDDVVEESSRTEQLLPFVTLVKIDVLGMPLDQLGSLSRSLKLKGKMLLAEKVETQEQFKICSKYGFDYFQGYYFARPDMLKGKKLSMSYALILQILGHVIKGSNNCDIVNFIKQDVALSLMLLRLVNTPMHGFRRHIASLGQALLILGDRQLKRWLQILLYADPLGVGASASSPLMMLASSRGKMLELLVQKIHPRRSNMSDTAFTVGILSLMDALFNMDIGDIVGKIGISMEIRDALLSRSGFYGELLALVELSEKPDLFDAGQVNAMLRSLGLSTEDFYESQKEAFEWANSISENMRSESSR